MTRKGYVTITLRDDTYQRILMRKKDAKDTMDMILRRLLDIDTPGYKDIKEIENINHRKFLLRIRDMMDAHISNYVGAV